MSDSSESAIKQQSAVQEIADIIADLEQYRDRLMQDWIAAAHRSNIQETAAIDQLHQHPELLKINQTLQKLKEQQAALDSGKLAGELANS